MPVAGVAHVPPGTPGTQQGACDQVHTASPARGAQAGAGASRIRCSFDRKTQWEEGNSTVFRRKPYFQHQDALTAIPRGTHCPATTEWPHPCSRPPAQPETGPGEKTARTLGRDQGLRGAQCVHLSPKSGIPGLAPAPRGQPLSPRPLKNPGGMYLFPEATQRTVRCRAEHSGSCWAACQGLCRKLSLRVPRYRRHTGGGKTRGVPFNCHKPLLSVSTQELGRVSFLQEYLNQLRHQLPGPSRETGAQPALGAPVPDRGVLRGIAPFEFPRPSHISL